MGRRAATSTPRRLGVFGGTFDPPHLGHLAVAEWARDLLRLDRVAFIPSGEPPHKRGRRITPPDVRVAMTRIAIRGHAAFEVLDIEARRSGPSFTVDTLEALKRRRPGTQLYFLMGKDSLLEFHSWHEPQRIVELAQLVVAGRPDGKGSGSAAAHPRGRPDRSLTLRVKWLENPELDIASSDLRKRVRSGRSIRYLVPDAVESYIRRRRLYAREA